MSKKPLQFFLIFIIFISVVGGVGYVLANRLLERKVPEPIGASKKGVLDTSSWKTYRNEMYGFEIQYPDDWNYEETVSGNGVYLFGVSFKPNTLTGEYKAQHKIINPIVISVVNRSFEREYGLWDYSVLNEQEDKVVVGGIEGIRRTGDLIGALLDEPVGVETKPEKVIEILIPYAGKVYEFIFHPKLNPSYFDTFEEMIRTAKFQK